VIRQCTAKAWAPLGVRDIAEPSQPDSDWYLHVHWFDRRSCCACNPPKLGPVAVPPTRFELVTPGLGVRRSIP
jgi:hypothetical protein